ncbi:AMP-binding protein [Cyanothece sp. BG0011]|uniref:AMP-binding protein n=1 Tax=Cyanothece sp. BG0011 TaxID=2082950 RepID=UPI000D1D821C|nr:AMP-binding protein [Cyanothece sp. BG0011]
MTVCLENQLNLLESTNLVDILRYRGEYQPDKSAYTFLADGETETDQLTYGTLLASAEAIAVELQSRISPGDRALLLYPSGLEFISAFFGCLLAGVVAIPVNLPKKNQKMKRVASILENAQTNVILSTQSQISALASQLALENVTYLATDTLNKEKNSQFQIIEISGDTLAFLQYTSGSTGDPKGVMVSHENILTNLLDQDLGAKHDQDSVIVTWLPAFHDMGLLYGILFPVYKGITCYMMPPIAFLQRPIRWLQVISKYGGTHTAAPNFAYQRCVDKITEEQIKALDLKGWKAAFNGAEPIKIATLKEFAQKFHPCGFNFQTFCPAYGLAEATLKVTTVTKDQLIQVCQVEKEALSQNRIVITDNLDNSQLLVSCGQTEIDTEIAIVNPDTLQRCQNDEVGEIWVKGKTIARGYWQRPEATQETFCATIADTGESPYLRTGDNGFLYQGQLYITGRLKDVIIIRGGNYYPQDIEQSVIESHPDLLADCSAAFTIEVEGEEQLVIVQEVARTAIRRLNEVEVIEAICQAVFEAFELSVYAIALIKPASIPKTSSGKIQRRLCRQQFLNDQLKLVSNWINPTAKKGLTDDRNEKESLGHSVISREDITARDIQDWLVTYFSKILNKKPQNLSINTPLANYGLDSVIGIELIEALEKWLNIEIEPTIYYDYPTIKALAEGLAEEINE